MSKKFQLRERGTGEILYPVTSQECILTRDGSRVLSGNEVENKLASLVESTPDYLSTLDSIKNRLSENPDESVALTKEIADAKKALFIDMWNEACGEYGTYNKETGYFELNEITDITYDEAIRIYQLWVGFGGKASTNYNDNNRTFRGVTVRTNIPMTFSKNASGDTENVVVPQLLFLSEIEVLRLYKRPYEFSTNTAASIFYQAPYIKKWLDTVFWHEGSGITSMTKYTFANSKTKVSLNFEYFRFANVNFDVDCQWFPKIGIDSFQYLVENRVSFDKNWARAFTITVHSNIYKALTGEAEYPFNGGTKEEWLQLAEDAVNKQISFATA